MAAWSALVVGCGWRWRSPCAPRLGDACADTSVEVQGIVSPPGPKVIPIALRKLAPASGTSQPEKASAPASSTAKRRAAPAPPENPARAPVPDIPAEDEQASRPRDWRADGIYRPGGGCPSNSLIPKTRSLIAARKETAQGPRAGEVARRKASRGEGESSAAGSRVGCRMRRGSSERKAGRDGYWQAVQDRLARGFDPGWDVLEQGPKDAPRSSLGAYLDSWKKQAAAYGRSGNPFSGLAGAPARPGRCTRSSPSSPTQIAGSTA